MKPILKLARYLVYDYHEYFWENKEKWGILFLLFQRLNGFYQRCINRNITNSRFCFRWSSFDMNTFF